MTCQFSLYKHNVVSFTRDAYGSSLKPTPRSPNDVFTVLTVLPALLNCTLHTLYTLIRAGYDSRPVRIRFVVDKVAF